MNGGIQLNHEFRFSPVLTDSGLEFTKQQQRRLKQRLDCPIYWIQPERRILWNTTLISHLFRVCNGNQNDPAHQRLVEKYIDSLPA